MNKKQIEELIEYVKKKHQCHTIIMYGSYTTGDFTQESDIDLICFTDTPKMTNDTSLFQGIPLDLWIHSTKEMLEFEEFIHINHGKILIDEKKLGIRLMDKINQTFLLGPTLIPKEEKEFYQSWIKKMYRRALKGDVEGNFRYHWLLYDSLEIYCKLVGIWYLGPKKTLNHLSKNDGKTFQLFDKALRNSAQMSDLGKLVEYLLSL